MSNFVIETYQFNNTKQAINWLAFCHYPVRVAVDGVEKIFYDFMSAEAFIQSATLSDLTSIGKK